MKFKAYFKYIFILLIFLVLIALLTALIFFYFRGDGLKNNNKNMDFDFKNVCINNNCFEVEVAKTAEEKKQGLMNKDGLSDGRGMLFVYSNEGFYSFWMKNMKFSLDIIWINKDKEIVHIEENIRPCQNDNCQSLSSKEKAMYVLEINSGSVKNLGIKKGDKVFFLKK